MGEVVPTRPASHKPHIRNTARYQPTEHQRRSSTQRGYGYKWQQVRAAYLAKHPLCVTCKAQGITKTATDLDHIKPHRGDMTIFWDSDNWQPLCRSCHSSKTATEENGFGNRGRDES